MLICSYFSFFLFCFNFRADSTTAETGSEVARNHGLSSFGLEVVAEMNRLGKGPFKYYVSTGLGGWVQKSAIFAY